MNEKIFCAAWTDNNTVLFMFTAHDETDMNLLYQLNSKKWKGILSSSINTINDESYLPVSKLIRDYNKNMRGSDENSQQWAYYTLKIRSAHY